ncbi:MAG: Sua5/YciO/YrdC/YwlC family protein, partial [Planctomycetota bacterium]
VLREIQWSSDSTAKTAPLVLSLRSREAAADFLPLDSALVRRLSQRCWPGPMTLQVPCDSLDSAMSRLPSKVERLLVDDEHGVAFRVVDQRVLAQVHRYLAAPLVLATVEFCGADPGSIAGGDASDAEALPATMTTAAAIERRFADKVPLLLDDGPTRYGGCSSLVRVLGQSWKLFQEGVIERAAMNQFAKPSIAVVCTGNTCRSPMAEVLLREKVKQKLGRDDVVDIVSAGVAAGNGCPASDQAVEVMRKRGLDLANHGSRMIDDALVGNADLILTMTRGHRAAILAAWPDLHSRVFTLRRDGGDITDPVGMSAEVYEQCADQISEELGAWLDSLDADFFPTEV